MAGAPSYNGAGAGGAIRFYSRASGSWTLFYEGFGLDLSVPGSFGIACSMNPEGDRAVVGSNGYSSSRGAISIFERTGTLWSRTDIMPNSGGDANEFFGSSVVINYQFVAGGAHGWDGSGTDRGRVAVYRHNGASYEYIQDFTGTADSDQMGFYMRMCNGTIIAGGGAGSFKTWVYTL
jgi:hypothetical protein